jgi:hypothetical protein
MKMTGKTLTLTKDEAHLLSRWLGEQAELMMGHAYKDDYFYPDFLSKVAHCLAAGHTIKVSAE